VGPGDAIRMPTQYEFSSASLGCELAKMHRSAAKSQSKRSTDAHDVIWLASRERSCRRHSIGTEWSRQYHCWPFLGSRTDCCCRRPVADLVVPGYISLRPLRFYLREPVNSCHLLSISGLPDSDSQQRLYQTVGKQGFARTSWEADALPTELRPRGGDPRSWRVKQRDPTAAPKVPETVSHGG
jgi:hypothetical protein